MVITMNHSTYSIHVSEQTGHYTVFDTATGTDVTDQVKSDLVHDLVLEIVELKRVMQIDDKS